MVNAIKVFKKSSPNEKVTAYMSHRDFVDHLTHTSPVDGVVLVDDDYLKGRKVFASVVITYRYGREEDEVMGLNFSKEYKLVNEEVSSGKDGKLSDIQKRLVEKFGASARPFSVSLPVNAPTSVTLEPALDDNEVEKPLGVFYDLKLYVAEVKEEQPHRRNSVSFAVRKVQYAQPKHDTRHPYTVVNKNFTLSPGKLNLEVSLHRDIYFHGDSIETVMKIHNGSKKTVKSIAVQIVQHVEITMTNTEFSRVVAGIETCQGCPITPAANLETTIALTPLTSNIKRFGIALDGKLKDRDANLASSTVAPAGKNIEDVLGIIVSYSVRVIHCGAISGQLSADVPFKLMHPDPEFAHAKQGCSLDIENFTDLRRGKSIDEELDED